MIRQVKSRRRGEMCSGGSGKGPSVRDGICIAACWVGGPGLVCVACPSADVDIWKGRPGETFRKTMHATQSGFSPHRMCHSCGPAPSRGGYFPRAAAVAAPPHHALSHPLSVLYLSILNLSILTLIRSFPCIWLQSATGKPQTLSEASTAHHPAQTYVYHV